MITCAALYGIPANILLILPEPVEAADSAAIAPPDRRKSVFLLRNVSKDLLTFTTCGFCEAPKGRPSRNVWIWTKYIYTRLRQPPAGSYRQWQGIALFLKAGKPRLPES
jgi:hypothetical protein